MSDTGGDPRLRIGIDATNIPETRQQIGDFVNEVQRADRALDESDARADQRAQKAHRRMNYIRAGVPPETIRGLEMQELAGTIREDSPQYRDELLASVTDPQARDAIRRIHSQYGIKRSQQVEAASPEFLGETAVGAAQTSGQTRRDIGTENEENRWQDTRRRYMLEEWKDYKKQASGIGVAGVAEPDEQQNYEKRIRNWQAMAEQLKRIDPMLGRVVEGIGMLAGGSGGLLTMAGVIGAVGTATTILNKQLQEFSNSLSRFTTQIGAANQAIEERRLGAGASVERIAEKYGYKPELGRDVYEQLKSKGLTEAEAIQSLEKAGFVPTLAETMFDVGAVSGGMPGQIGRRATQSPIASTRAAQEQTQTARDVPNLLSSIDNAIKEANLTGDAAMAYKRAAIIKALGLTGSEATRASIAGAFGVKDGQLQATEFTVAESGYANTPRGFGASAGILAWLTSKIAQGRTPAEIESAMKLTQDAMPNIVIQEFQNGGFKVIMNPDGKDKRPDSKGRQLP